MENKYFNLKQFVIVTLITSIWIIIAETARGYYVAYPRMVSFFEGTKVNIITYDQIQISHALIWGLWSLILTAVLVFMYWLCMVAFNNKTKSIIISGTTTTFATLGIFWIATVNAGLGEWSTAFVIFPLALIELLIGAWIASKLYSRKS